MADRSIASLERDYENFVFKFGHATIGAAKALVWDGSVATFNTLNQTTDELFSIVSDSIADNMGQGGATHIKFIYQDLAGVEYESPEMILNGTTIVNVPLITGAIVYRAWVTQSEDTSELTGPNTGRIKIFKTGTPATIFAEIPPQEGQTLMCIYRVPANKYAELKSLSIDAGTGFDAKCWLRTRNDRDSAWRTRSTFTVSANLHDQERMDPGLILPGSDVVIIAIGGGAGTEVDAHFELELKDLAP